MHDNGVRFHFLQHVGIDIVRREVDIASQKAVPVDMRLIHDVDLGNNFFRALGQCILNAVMVQVQPGYPV